MQNKETTRAALMRHCARYPRAEISDIFKFLFQSAFGCEHLVTSLERAHEWIEKEYSICTAASENYIDELDGNYSRVHLSYIKEGLAPLTLAKLFLKSAKKEEGGEETLKCKLKVAKKLVIEGKLNFSLDEFENALSRWEALGYPPIHHSEEFRRAYAPAYRVIENGLVALLPLLTEIDKARKCKKDIGVACGDMSDELLLLLTELYSGEIALFTDEKEAEKRDGTVIIHCDR